MRRESRGEPEPAVLRIAIDVRGLQHALLNSPDGGLGGVGRYALGLVAGLLRRAEDTRYLLLIDRGTVPERLRLLVESDPRTSLHRIGTRALRVLRRGRVARLFDLLESPLTDLQIMRLRPDVVHVLDQPSPPTRRRPRIVTFHDFYHAVAPPQALGYGAALDALERRVLRLSASADLAICVSARTAQLAKDILGCEPNRMRVVHPGIDTSLFCPAPRQTMRRRGAGTPYFLHVGVLRPRKNPAGLLRAFHEIAVEEPTVELVCAGPYHVSPDVLVAVQQLARQLGLADRVRFVTECSDDVLVSLYRDAVALVFPSNDEGFGFPALESLACGTPCVVSRAGSLPEVCGELGVFVDPGDSASIAAGMRRVNTDNSLRDRVRAEGPAWAARFSWDAMAADILASYYDIAQRGKSPAKGIKPERFLA